MPGRTGQSRSGSSDRRSRDQGGPVQTGRMVWGLGASCDALAGTCSSPVEDRQVRPSLGVRPEPQPPPAPPQLSLRCPPIRLHAPGPHTHWPPGHVLNVASGSVEPGASLVGRDLPPGPQVQNKSSRAFLQRLRREPCFSAPGASGPGVPTGQAQQFRSSAPPPSWWAQGSPPCCMTISELGPQACPCRGSGHFPSQSNLTSAWSGDTRKTPSPESSALRLLGPPSQ